MGFLLSKMLLRWSGDKDSVGIGESWWHPVAAHVLFVAMVVKVFSKNTVHSSKNSKDADSGDKKQ